jgi:hypothetical protein
MLALTITFPPRHPVESTLFRTTACADVEFKRSTLPLDSIDPSICPAIHINAPSFFSTDALQKWYKALSSRVIINWRGT